MKSQKLYFENEDARFDIMRSILPEGMWLKPTYEKK